MWRALDEIAQVSSGYPFRGKVENDPDGALIVLQQKDISELVALDPGQLAKVVPDGAARVAPTDSYARHRLVAGDVLLHMRGGQFLSLVFAGHYPAVAAQGVAVVRPKDALLPAFLHWFLSHPRTLAKLRSLAGGTHIPFLSIKDLSSYRVPLPTLEVQQQVIAADAVRRQQHAAMQQLMTLNNQLVDAATWQAATRKPTEPNRPLPP